MKQELSQTDRENLSAWMDGELSPQEAEIVAQNVETDSAWAQAYRELLTVDATLEAWNVPPAPDDLTERIFARARRRPEPVILRVGRWALTAAAVALIVVGLALHYNRRQATAHQQATAGLAGSDAGVPDTFVRDGMDVFHGLPDRIPPKGVRIFIRKRPLGSTSQPALWRELTPQQQAALRQRALAFLQLTPEQQQRVLREYENAARAASQRTHRLWKQRHGWLQAVVESFTPEERTNLLTLTPAERGRLFLRRRKELIRAGKLPPPPPESPK